MDSTTLDFALMAGDAYFSKRDDKNKIPMPTGATLIDSRALASGYEARAYNYGGKIVISIAGTYFPDQFLGRLGSGTVTPTDSAGLKDMATNVNLFAGGLDQQLKDVAASYADIVTTTHTQGNFTQPCRRTRRASAPARLRARGLCACTAPLDWHQHRGLRAHSVASANWLRRSGTATRYACRCGWRGEEVEAPKVHSTRVLSTKWLGSRTDTTSSIASNGVSV